MMKESVEGVEADGSHLKARPFSTPYPLSIAQPLHSGPNVQFSCFVRISISFPCRHNKVLSGIFLAQGDIQNFVIAIFGFKILFFCFCFFDIFCGVEGGGLILWLPHPLLLFLLSLLFGRSNLLVMRKILTHPMIG